MPTTQERQNLIDTLLGALIKEGYTIENADSGNYPKPTKIGRHEPDIIAKNQSGLIVIGKAKTREDLSGEISKEQFIDFSNRIMSDGPLKDQAVPFHIVVKKDIADDLRLLLASLGLSNKIGNIITIWTL